MDKRQLKEIKRKLECLSDEDKFEEAISIINDVPEKERDLQIKVTQAQILNNMAMASLEDYNPKYELYIQNEENDEQSHKAILVREAIKILEPLKEEGTNDCFWNQRMGFAYYSMGHILKNQSFYYYSLALPHFQKWSELEKKVKKKKAIKILDECRENLADRCFSQKKYLLGFSIINELSSGWDSYMPNFYIKGTKEEKQELDDYIANGLEELAEKGNLLLEQGYKNQALLVWQYAIDLIPEPKYEKPEVVWFEASMGDVYFNQGDYNQAELIYGRAVENLSGAGKESFLLMRYGECLYETKKLISAKQYFLKAYMIDGEEVFRREERNIKYLDFLLAELEKDEERKKYAKRMLSKRDKTKKINKTHSKYIFDENYVLVEDMVKDNYYPAFLVVKLQRLFYPVIELLEIGEKDETVIHEKLDEFSISVNQLQDSFREQGSDIETVARESIGETVEYILDWFDINIDIEEALRERDW